MAGQYEPDPTMVGGSGASTALALSDFADDGDDPSFYNTSYPDTVVSFERAWDWVTNNPATDIPEFKTLSVDFTSTHGGMGLTCEDYDGGYSYSSGSISCLGAVEFLGTVTVPIDGLFGSGYIDGNPDNTFFLDGDTKTEFATLEAAGDRLTAMVYGYAISEDAVVSAGYAVSADIGEASVFAGEPILQ